MYRRLDIDINLVKHLYNSERKSICSIAEQFHCSEKAIWNRLKQTGIRLRGRHQWQTEIEKSKKDEIIHLYTQEKLSGKQVGERVGYSKHTIWRILKKYGIPRRKGGRLMFGERNPAWKGGSHITPFGYKRILVGNHPRANNGYVFEHIIVWEKTHNQSVPKGYVIHHLNGIKTDNRPENLIAMKRSEHINLAEPYKKRIRELEEEIKLLKEKLKPVIS